MKERNKRYTSKKIVDGEDLNKESFNATITFLKEEARRRNAPIADADIANAIHLTAEQFRTYFESDKAPDEIFPLLRSSFKELLGTTTHHRIIHTVSFPDPLESDDSEEE